MMEFALLMGWRISPLEIIFSHVVLLPAMLAEPLEVWEVVLPPGSCQEEGVLSSVAIAHTTLSVTLVSDQNKSNLEGGVALGRGVNEVLRLFY